VILFRSHFAILLSAALLATPAFATRTHHRSTSTAHPAITHTAAGHTTAGHAAASHSASAAHLRSLHRPASKSKARATRPRGQQSIQPERVTEIQQALIREHYLNAEANGRWDAATEAAMQKYQADQGWQTKLMPDSRALKKLGLGPDYSGAINADGSSFTPPPPASTIPSDVAAGFAQAAGVN
jgi:peptidoglycan hydrolase-like protein with peptidoglycan-binding domain